MIEKTAWAELSTQLRGELHTDRLRRWLLATDGSYFQKMPAAVVYPADTADIQAAVRFAARHGLSVHARGAGSGLCGSSLGGGLVVDFSRFMNRLLRLDAAGGWFECQPGYRFGELEAALKGSGLFFPPDPSSGEYATFGGMCATNASGAHSVKYGNVADYLLDAEVVFADGSVRTLSGITALAPEDLPSGLRELAQLYNTHAADLARAYPPIACNVAGYNLRDLVVDGRLRLHRLIAGAEGTLGLVTRLKFRLAPRPAADSLVVAYFEDAVQSARAVQSAMPLSPSGIEFMDKSLLQLARDSDPVLAARIPAGIDNVLMIEFDGSTREACARDAQRLLERIQAAGVARNAYVAVSAEEKEKFWALRKAAVPILYKLLGRRKILALVEDAAVPVERLVDYFKGIYAIFERLGVSFVLYGHIAKGLMHTRPLLDLKDPADIARLRPIADAVYDLVDGLGGTVSGEHGDGRLRSAYLRRKYPGIYPLFEQTKRLLDPCDSLNPEIKKAGDPDQMARDLRYGTAYRATDLPEAFLRWNPAFVEEVERCHGCSKCTTVTTATRMCPVYKFTRDETAAPKAKANVLRALISGAVEARALYEDRLQAVMNQCVNCGSCYLECPSNVNIPKLAMEAKAHYVRRFGARWTDRLTVRVEEAARLLRKGAPLIAPAAGIQAVRNIAARLTGLAAQRPTVVFAARSLFERLPSVLAGAGPRVLFYAGCYAAYIRPELGLAAVQVLRRMDFAVHLPAQFCCGLPHLSKGMAADAGKKIKSNLSAWRSLLRDIDFIVVTCSSCGYALMQDWSYLVETADTSQIKAKVIHITRLLEKFRERLPMGRLAARLAYHQPCHLRLQPDAGSSARLLGAIAGVDLIDLQSHCCGMAGSWGMAAAHYTLSTAIGAPMTTKLNGARADFGVTDCPTCQMQMEHLGRPPVRHPIEIVRDSLGNERGWPTRACLHQVAAIPN